MENRGGAFDDLDPLQVIGSIDVRKWVAMADGDAGDVIG